MRKYIILAALLLSTTTLIKAQQCNLPYKSLKSFSNDTTAYLMYNFRDRTQCYEDKTFSEVVKDLEIPIKDFMVIGSNYNANNSVGIYLYIYPREKAMKMVDREQEPHTIEIIWKYDTDFKKTLSATRKRPGDRWNKKAMNYFKDLEIKEIRTVIYEFSKFYNKYYSKPNYEL